MRAGGTGRRSRRRRRGGPSSCVTDAQRWRRSVPCEQVHEPERLQISRHERARIVDAADEPAEIGTVGPPWDRGLLAAQEADRGAEAMDARPIRELALEKQAELFLGAAS